MGMPLLREQTNLIDQTTEAFAFWQGDEKKTLRAPALGMGKDILLTLIYPCSYTRSRP